MKRQTQTILYHVLPVAFWLLAAGGIAIWTVFHLPFTVTYFVPAVLVLISAAIIRRIPRHTSSVEPCFQTAILIGIAAYWLPSVVCFILLIWGYLIYQNLFDSRSFFATLIGLATVALWVGVLVFIRPDIFHFSVFTAHLEWWIPTGSVFVAYIASTTAQRILRVR